MYLKVLSTILVVRYAVKAVYSATLLEAVYMPNKKLSTLIHRVPTAHPNQRNSALLQTGQKSPITRCLDATYHVILILYLCYYAITIRF